MSTTPEGGAVSVVAVANPRSRSPEPVPTTSGSFVVGRRAPDGATFDPAQAFTR